MPASPGSSRYVFRFMKCGGVRGALGVDFAAVDANRLRRGDAEANPLALDGQDGDPDLAIDDDGFADTTCEYEHGGFSAGELSRPWPCPSHGQPRAISSECERSDVGRGLAWLPNHTNPPGVCRQSDSANSLCREIPDRK